MIDKLIDKKELKDHNILQLYKFLEKKLNIKIVLSQEEISASMPTKNIKQYLHVEENIPIIIRKMLIFDENKNKIAYSIGYYLSSKFTFNLEISR